MVGIIRMGDTHSGEGIELFFPDQVLLLKLHLPQVFVNFQG